MDLNVERFRVEPEAKVALKARPTLIKPLAASQAEYKQHFKAQAEELRELQKIFFAANRYALLLIFQGMDASGKDSAIGRVMSGINPQGCQVFSFKHPSPQELAHDFLWRASQRLPERGRIGIFNRSYFEEVLIVRVHPEILKGEAVPDQPDADAIWSSRYRSILNFEKHLHRNGTRIIKFFLHLSKAEQRQRFLQRIDDPNKNWKFNAGDLEERKYWRQYRAAYEGCLSATSTRHAPWYVVPADRKDDTQLIIASIVINALKDLNLRYPRPTARRRKELLTLRRSLMR